MSERLRVVVATPLSPADAELIVEREPRIDLVHEPELMASPTANWMVRHERDAADQRRYEQLVDSAHALFGVPDQSGRALARTVAANPRLRWVHTIPAGGGQQVRSAGLDQDALERITFTTSAGVHAQPLAEFALLGVLAGAKLVPDLQYAQQRREWGERVVMGLAADMTVGVLGLGSIGRRTAELLAAVGYRVVGIHRHPVEAAGVREVRPVSPLGPAIADLDALVLALPGTEQTYHLLDGVALESAKPGLTVVNVGRGTTVDEGALVEAIDDGRVGYAALDVTEVEPLPAESPLWQMPNVLISPHTAAISDHEPRLIAELFAANATALLDGTPMKNVVDTVEFY